ncbi:MAG: sulfatase [Planctomycetes bacterium]|nr:sulfatase [Planctomycetota bacterium]
MNVIAIMTDTFRYDHLGFTGKCPWWKVHTPKLDAFAKKCLVLDRAYQASFPTIPTRTDMMTGRFTFPVRGWTPLPPDEVVLAMHMTEADYVSMLICDTPHLIRDGHQFDRGFTAWDWMRGQEGDRSITDDIPVPLQCAPEKVRGPERMQKNHYRWRAANWKTERDTFVARTMQRACDWLERNYTHEKFFLYIDTFDPHEPWDPPQHYVDLYDPGYEGEIVDHPVYDYCDYLSPAELKHTQALYSGECTLVSTWIGRLLEKVERLGLMDNTAITIISDHGHYIGDHGRIGKSGKGPDGPWPYYEPVAHIVWMWYVPGTEGGRHADFLAQPVDFFPTILDLAGVPKPEPLDGVSLAPLLKGEKLDAKREVAVTTRELPSDPTKPLCTSITDGEWTLHYRGPDLPSELYHLTEDPAEEKNVFAEKRNEAERLHAAHLDVLKSARTVEEKIKPRTQLPKE